MFIILQNILLASMRVYLREKRRSSKHQRFLSINCGRAIADKKQDLKHLQSWNHHHFTATWLRKSVSFLAVSTRHGDLKVDPTISLASAPRLPTTPPADGRATLRETSGPPWSGRSPQWIAERRSMLADKMQSQPRLPYHMVSTGPYNSWPPQAPNLGCLCTKRAVGGSSSP